MPRRKTRKNHKGGTSVTEKLNEGVSGLKNAASNAAKAAAAAAENTKKGLNDISKARDRQKNMLNMSTLETQQPTTYNLSGGKRKSRIKKRKTKRRKKRRTKRRRKSRRKRRR